MSSGSEVTLLLISPVFDEEIRLHHGIYDLWDGGRKNKVANELDLTLNVPGS
jgi:hypothetical protein